MDHYVVLLVEWIITLIFDIFIAHFDLLLEERREKELYLLQFLG